ncbi:hypothetical protein BZB76_4140 [Actinomadura pelletieri DSM 43383]|uniref:Uncharacterized protein n=1 Tax=Actinomadura pelletieri DSM 43383 TaxID=1120940 RepID=A0A495QLL8_9ACTN|nr:hypothetical protein [Actinomadura pelletieri]RKS73449.1 hypothetical protein BZB76_4140 [Actinomadura pelletieri DSM 43383]
MTPPTQPAAGGPPNRGASFGLATTVLAVPTGVALINPDLAAILASAELTLLLTVLLTAVFAPAPINERAFRLLRWMSGHPEPTHPTSPDQRSHPERQSAP